MSAPAEILQSFWLGMGIHLWQTILVLGLLGLLGLGLRRAPARWTHLLWTAGLIKLFLPLAILGEVTDRLWQKWGAGSPEGPGRQAMEAVGAVLDPARGLGGSDAPSFPHVVPVVITVLWLGGVAWFFGRLLRDARRSRLDGIRPEDMPAGARRCLDAALAETKIPRDRVCVTGTSIMPSVAGILRPRVFVPSRLIDALPPEELRAVLLHEDQHRLRYDPLQGLVQRLAMILFFFFPLLHPLLRRLRETAEFACDEAALDRGVPAAVYRRALARTMKLGLDPSSATAAALGGGRSLLRQRFNRLDQPWRYRSMPHYRLIVLVAAVLVAAGSFLPLGATAEDPSSERELTKVPVPIHTVAPEYPDECKRAGVSGRVLVGITVSEKGLVSAVEILEGVEDCPALDQASVAAAIQWRFEPGEIDGEPVVAEMAIPFKFALH